MKKSALILTVLMLLLSAACSSYVVRFDYDEKEDFAAYRTFGFHPIPEDLRAGSDEGVLDRIREAVARELEAKGFARASEDPDLLIAIHTERRDRFSITDWGYHYAPFDAYHRGEDYWYGSGIDVLEYEEVTLILDVVRADEDELIWRGAYSDALPRNLTPDKAAKIVDQAVARILANFPPGPRR